MNNLFDIVMNAGNGQAVQAMMRQFGLNQAQMTSALEALLPAFSQGLKRNTADPYGLGAVMQAMMAGGYGQFFSNPAAAFTPAGMSAGNAVLGQLFKSKDLSRAVASQAAAATGIGQEILKQMLPALATMLMGGLAQQTMMKASSGGFGASGNIFGEIIDQMMKQGMGQARLPEPQPEPMDNPLGKILEGMFGGGRATPDRAPNPMGDNPLGRIFEEMMKGGLGGASPRPRSRGDEEEAGSDPAADNPLGRVLEEMLGGGRRETRERRPGPRTAPPEEQIGRRQRPKNPYDDLFGEMFESGRKTRDEYQNSLDRVFDQFLKGQR